MITAADETEFLSVQHLSKSFVNRQRTVHAVTDVSFQVRRGELMGLLGPNGAGKTTIIKSILGLVKPDAGTITIDNVDAKANPKYVSQKVAAVLEGARNVYWRLSTWENIAFFAGLHGLSVSKHKDYFEYLLEVLKLQDQRHTPVRNLSAGYKQKVAVACALAKRTPLVFLDEPTLGLDVQAGYDLREALRRLQQEEGRTMVVSSHDMHFVQNICSRVVIVSGGRIITDKSVQDLLSLFQKRVYRITIARPDGIAMDRLADDVRQRFPQATFAFQGDTLEVSIHLDHPTDLYDLFDILRAAQATVNGINQTEVDLETAFLKILKGEDTLCG